MSEVDRETGDRDGFLGRLVAREALRVPAGPHPPPKPPETVPEVRFRSLDGVAEGDHEALLAVFVAAAERADAHVHLVDAGDEAVGRVVTAIVDRHTVRRAVLSPEPEAQALGRALRDSGVLVGDYEPGAAADADLGVTGAAAAIAATGSVVVDADRAGGRAASLLPTVHLCVVPRHRIVATTGDVLRRSPGQLPSHRVLITGPSRTGDIEQILTTGMHGPAAVHIVVT